MVVATGANIVIAQGIAACSVYAVKRERLPAGLHNTRDLALERETTEAQTADAELAQERARTTAKLAAVVLAGLELRNSCIFDALCSSSHIYLFSS